MRMKRVVALVMLFKSKVLWKISEQKTCLNSKSRLDRYADNGRGQNGYQNGSKDITLYRSQNHDKQLEKSIHYKRKHPIIGSIIAEDKIIRVRGRLKPSSSSTTKGCHHFQNPRIVSH